MPVMVSGNLLTLFASIVASCRLLFPEHAAMEPVVKRVVPSDLPILTEKND